MWKGRYGEDLGCLWKKSNPSRRIKGETEISLSYADLWKAFLTPCSFLGCVGQMGEQDSSPYVQWGEDGGDAQLWNYGSRGTPPELPL